MVIAVKNLDRTIKKFDKIGMVDMKPYIQEATQKVQRTAKEECPKKTGHLKRNIKRKTIKTGNTVIGTVYDPVEYGVYQEFGTSKMKGKPFMRPALKYHEKDIEKGVKDYIQKEIRKAIL
jgi:HK97 gp10 family phage protein